MLVFMMLLSFYNLMVAKSRVHTQKEVSISSSLLYFFHFEGIWWFHNPSTSLIGVHDCFHYVHRCFHRGDSFLLLHIRTPARIIRGYWNQSDICWRHEGNVWRATIIVGQYVQCFWKRLAILACTHPSLHISQLPWEDVYSGRDKKITALWRGLIWRRP